MKLIPQDEIDTAALNDTKSIDRIDGFKAGVEFAESKFQEAFTEIIIENQGLKLYKDNEAKRFEELAIEFADWINVSKQGFHSLYREKNSTTPIYWAEALVGGKIDYTSKDLYQQFIKDRDAKD